MNRIRTFFAAGVVALSVFSATTRAAVLSWSASPDPRVAGYFVYFGTNTPARNFTAGPVDAGAGSVLPISLPPGTWYAVVAAYSTNNTSGVPIESVPSNEVVFYIPRSPTNEVAVDCPLAPPLMTLASNAQMRVTVFLQRSTNLVRWTEGVPVLQYDVRDGTSAFYRTRLTAQRLP